MTVTAQPDVSRAIERSRPEDITPVTLDADALDSTAPEYLRELKRELNDEGVFPVGVTVTACFDADCSLETQSEVDRIRGVVRAASFLGAGSVTVVCDAVENPRTVRPAIAACAERAEREGLRFEFDGPIDVDVAA